MCICIYSYIHMYTKRDMQSYSEAVPCECNCRRGRFWHNAQEAAKRNKPTGGRSCKNRRASQLFATHLTVAVPPTPRCLPPTGTGTMQNFKARQLASSSGRKSIKLDHRINADMVPSRLEAITVPAKKNRPHTS